MTQEPTSTGAPRHDPTVCWACGRRAVAVGMGEFGRRGDQDPKYLCELCLPLMHQLRAARQFDRYENNALRATVDAAGALVEQFGSDLAEWTEDQVHEFATSIILGFGDSIREQVKNGEVPF